MGHLDLGVCQFESAKGTVTDLRNFVFIEIANRRSHGDWRVAWSYEWSLILQWASLHQHWEWWSLKKSITHPLSTIDYRNCKWRTHKHPLLCYSHLDFSHLTLLWWPKGEKTSRIVCGPDSASASGRTPQGKSVIVICIFCSVHLSVIGMEEASSAVYACGLEINDASSKIP